MTCSGVLSSSILFEASVSSFASTASTLPFLASAFALSCLIVDHRLSAGQKEVRGQVVIQLTYGLTAVAPTALKTVGIEHTVAGTDLSRSV